MRFATSILALAAPLFVAAAPWKRQDNAKNLLVLSAYRLLFSFLFFFPQSVLILRFRSYPTAELTSIRSSSLTHSIRRCFGTTRVQVLF